MSLFFFADDAAGPARARYDLMITSAKFGDERGFAAVWTPERHFHRFGGNYPNPSLTSAALAVATERIAIRAGSVVAPLHHPLRIAEEWSVVDNLSGGRAGISLASGWNEADFLFRPENYPDRSRITIEYISLLRSLWRGEPYPADAASGGGPGPRIFPHPVSAELPLWLTASGRPETFRAAGRAGVGILTHLAGQSIEELKARIGEYREEFARSARPGRGHVVLMVHTLVGADFETVEAVVREPLETYLLSAMSLFHPSAAGGSEPGVAGRGISRARALHAIRPAYERYLRHGCGLFGSVDQAEAQVDRFAAAGVDEVACLIDFGVPHGLVLGGLEYLDLLRRRVMPA